MTHGRITQTVDRAVAIGIIGLVCMVLTLARVAEAMRAARVRVSRAHGVALPAFGSRVAALRGLQPRDARMDVADMERAARVEAFAAGTVGVARVGTATSGVEPESGLFI